MFEMGWTERQLLEDNTIVAIEALGDFIERLNRDKNYGK